MKIVSKTEEKVYAMLAVTLTQFVNTAAIFAVRGLLMDKEIEESFNKSDANISFSVTWYKIHS